MGDRVIGKQPGSVQTTGVAPGGKPAATGTATVQTFNPAAKAIDDTLSVGTKTTRGAIPAVQLTESEPEPITQADMTLSASRESAMADDDLNAAYHELKPTLDAGAKAKLVTAQKAWVTYRNAESTFAGLPYAGGSMAPMMVMSACASLTQQRTTELIGWKAMITTAGPDGPAAAKDGAAARAKAADKDLNAAYKKLAAAIEPANKPKLLATQKAWLAFRDAECAFAGPAMKDATLAELTETRTKQLQSDIPETF